MSWLSEADRRRRGLGAVSYRIPRQVTKCRTYRKGKQSTVIRYVHAATWVWRENTWRSVIDVGRGLPEIGFQNGQAFASPSYFREKNRYAAFITL